MEQRQRENFPFYVTKVENATFILVHYVLSRLKEHETDAAEGGSGELRGFRGYHYEKQFQTPKDEQNRNYLSMEMDRTGNE